MPKWPKNSPGSEDSVDRSSATRIISSVIKVLATGDVLQFAKHAVKLNQQRANLQQKQIALRQLDTELLALVGEDKIESEIERADLVEENIQLAIANIDNALASNVNASTVVSNPSEQSPVQLSTSANTLTEEGRGENGSSPLKATLVDSSVSSLGKTQVKLPKLVLKKFNGDHSKWISFWDTFEASVHKNENLSPIDKFNYLILLLEWSATESISGLMLTASNYDEAIEILNGRFGNKQQIINHHMEILPSLDSVTSHHNMRSLRKLHDTVESNVRSSKSLGVPRESYCGLLSSILMIKLLQEFRLVITKEVGDDDWQLDQLLTIFKRELEARERAGGTTVNGDQPPSPPKLNRNDNRKDPGTTSTLLNGNANGPTCTYCRGNHPSKDCKTVTDVQTCKMFCVPSKRSHKPQLFIKVQMSQL